MSTKSINVIKRLRNNFGKYESVIDMPYLMSIQKDSYNSFLQFDTPPEKRENKGLQAAFQSVFPIKDFMGIASLNFVSYSFGKPKKNINECIARGMTYEIPIHIKVRLIVYNVDKEAKTSSVRDIKEQEIYFGTIPFMTDRGTFVINGTERVVVSQLHKSSGVFFDHDQGKSHSSGKIIYSSRIIPVRGSWIDIEIDHKDIVYIKIDRRRKIPITTLFKAFGYTDEDILSYFYLKDKYVFKSKSYFKVFNETTFEKQRASYDIKDPKTDEIIVKKGRIITKKIVAHLKQAEFQNIPITQEELYGKAFAVSIYNKDMEKIVSAGELIDEESLELLNDNGIKEFEVLFVDIAHNSDSIRKTLEVDKIGDKVEALNEIYKRLRPGNLAMPDVVQDFIDHLFFKSAYYDLSDVGRLKINHRLNSNTELDVKTLRKEDIFLTAKTLIGLKDSQGSVDDIDHLGNRRIRTVGELVENQYRIGLVRMERAIKERMSMQEVDSFMPNDLVNSKPVAAVIQEFFGTSQLSQFMDQTNPLSETTHKRRLSALGPGGLTRERAGFEVRDVHPSHYGRICPIETPEGPNIGLIVSLCTFAVVNELGFIETPYRVVEDGRVTNDIKYLTAFEEYGHPIAQANAPIDDKGNYINDTVAARVSGEAEIVEKNKIEYMDVSPHQLVSVSSSLIPFLENDDANRALMGSNMMRQAVPLAVAEAPLVGTGMESKVAKDSGTAIVAKKGGVVVDLDATKIIVRNDDGDEDLSIYELAKFDRTNQNTCINNLPIVKKGEKITEGQIIADGTSTEQGELAIGKNVTVAFMPWEGYNFEDSILVNEKLVREGRYTSVHIEEFEVVARDTRLGNEEITRDIPNVGEEALKDLDESGIIRLGAEVKQGDILVGKISPKSETQLSPEEKLLRSIFGEKASDVKDTSLRVPPSVSGIVTNVKIFSRKGTDKDKRTTAIEEERITILEKNRDENLEILNVIVKEKIAELIVGKKLKSPLKKNKKVIIDKKVAITKKDISSVPIFYFKDAVFEKNEITDELETVLEKHRNEVLKIRNKFEGEIENLKKGEDLPPGIIKLIKVYVAMKRFLSVGDKMSGRHGNKGVVSRILPIEDMPFFKNGKTVDMVLNPLGVPSRMNVGQVLEVHLGRAAKSLGDQITKLIKANEVKELKSKFERIFKKDKKTITSFNDREVLEFANYYKKGVHMATPVFDGAKEEEIKELLKEANVLESGQSVLYDGRTGERFDNEVTVGIMYVLKLNHLVDDKIHARSIGPYSLITQQPLGGKAQFGGQRLGEMEVWAIEAYGAASALQEFITIKSDDMVGRTKMYEKIVKGQTSLESGIPEAFKVLRKELKSLCLNLELLEVEDS